MTKYRKKPIVIEALQYDGTLESLLSLKVTEIEQDFVSKEATIITLKGNILVRLGDYVIKGIAGELYSCKSDIFYKTYEAVE